MMAGRADRVAWISVPLVDEPHRDDYPRPDVLEIIDAQAQLRELDAAGLLSEPQAVLVRVLLAAVGRLSATDVAEAFAPTPTRSGHLRAVTGSSTPDGRAR